MATVQSSPAGTQPAAEPVESPVGKKAGAKTKPLTIWSAVDFVLDLLSSVPFGLILLILLISACMTGMLIQQQELPEFSKYYASLTPAERIVYGRLNFFDIYHAWYFNVLLLLLSLNIILASIDHFPAAWSFIAKKKLTASPTFAKAQRTKGEVELPGVNRASLVERARQAARTLGFKTKVTEEETRTTIFAERGVWNRLGAYLVHISLLTIFVGGFRTSQGYTGMMRVVPEKQSDRMMQSVFSIDNAAMLHNSGMRELELPFTIEGVDIQQKLIDKSKGIDMPNTLDWITRVRIHDKETGRKDEALIHMNHPFDYRGYRMFQTNWIAQGNARQVKIRVTPTAGGTAQDITLERSGQAKLQDGTIVRYREFNPAFTVNREGHVEMSSADYDNPAAHLDVIYPDGDNRDVWALNEAGRLMFEQAPFLKEKFGDTGKYSFTLTDFEKVGTAHDISIQFDPGIKIVYTGFLMLCLSLMAVFFFSHQRLWLVVEEGKITLGGDANRNRLGFEDRMKRVMARIRGEQELQTAP
ncbi:MAG: cytochrome c biogenesis protein ResB [Acidobacteria bacterium]|nr:cytochrome c biogenesis protein ResB [Acidobacteriota bacterium]MBI3425885.1 cytochrome c biogenesis protein ResB [Acidobacteriota bacterium]